MPRVPQPQAADLALEVGELSAELVFVAAIPTL